MTFFIKKNYIYINFFLLFDTLDDNNNVHTENFGDLYLLR